MSLERQFRRLLEQNALDLPPLGEGATPQRLRLLADIARHDVSLGRLAEAHADAVQILREAGRTAVADVWYGVWAAEDPNLPLSLRRTDSGWMLDGTKVFCTGADLVDRALVTVRTPEAMLVDVDLRSNRARIHVDASSWITPAFAETATAVVRFRAVELAEDAIIGGDGWYLERSGFWNGACGPAACWAGGAQGLIDWALARSAAAKTGRPQQDAAVGALSALGFQMEAVLDHAGRAIDHDPRDRVAAHIRALQARHCIERACTEILDRFGRAFGPRPLAFEEATQRRVQEVQLYIRQCHAEWDLQTLGTALRQRWATPQEP